MSVEGKQITDYSQFNANPWLIEFFRDSNVIGVLSATDQQFEELEQVLYDMLVELWIDNAEGEQLDVLGVHVGIDRDGRNDSSYRTVIKAQIEINISSGEPEALIKAVQVLFNTTNVLYTPEYPAKVRIWTDQDLPITFTSNMVDHLGNQLVDNLGNSIITESSNDSALSVLLGVVPSGVGLLIDANIIDHEGNFIVDHLGNFLVGPQPVL